jgi:hypothetical protein
MNVRPAHRLIGIALAAALAAPALAQGWMMQGQGRGPGMTPGMGPGMMRGWSEDDWGSGMRGMMRDPGRFVAGRLAFIEAELGLTEAQRPLWEAYAAAARDAARSMSAMHERMLALEGPPALPERLALMEEMMASRLSALRTVRDEATALYRALSPEQQEIADSVMAMGMGMGGM